MSFKNKQVQNCSTCRKLLSLIPLHVDAKHQASSECKTHTTTTPSSSLHPPPLTHKRKKEINSKLLQKEEDDDDNDDDEENIKSFDHKHDKKQTKQVIGVPKPSSFSHMIIKSTKTGEILKDAAVKVNKRSSKKDTDDDEEDENEEDDNKKNNKASKDKKSKVQKLN